MPRSETFNMDCLDYMKQCKDKQFSMIYTDPPYADAGAGNFNSKHGRFGGLFAKYHDGLITQSPEPKRVKVNHASGGNLFGKYGEGAKHWDSNPPPEEFWEQAFRISDYQIIWGGNYFFLPPSRNFIIWEKGVPETFSMAMCEYAWVSFDGNAKIVRGRSQDKFRWHPTAKPIRISREVLRIHGHLAKPKGIFDPYMGSGSFRIAAYEAGIDYVGIELDKNYFEKEETRFNEYLSTGSLYEEDEIKAIETTESEGLF